MVGAGPQRLRRLAVGLGAIVAALPSMVVAFGLHDLSTGGLSLGDAGRRRGDPRRWCCCSASPRWRSPGAS